MAITSDDISIVLSGGLSNTDPDHSLGGNASLFDVGTNINNLFADITSAQSTSGYTDFRCIYVENTSAIDSFYDVNVGISSQVTGGSTVQLGVLQRNEVQLMTVSGSPTGGYIIINYEGALSPHISYSTNPAIFVVNLQNGLNATTGLSQVVCSQGSTSSKFIITYGGNDGSRNQNILSIDTNALTPSVANPVFIKTTSGGPKNDIAGVIASPAVVPSGVVFSSETVILGILRPEEGFPIWVKRVTPAGSVSLANDGFNLQLTGTAFS